MVDVSKLSQYTIVRAPLEVSKLSVLVPMVAPLYVGKVSLYAVVGSANVQINRAFDFDYKIKLSSDVEFDWRINTVFNRVFDFDYKLDAGYFNIDFSFDWKIRLGRTFDFDYTIEDQPPDAGTPIPGGAHSYWRIRYRSAEVDNAQFSEVYFLDAAGTDLDSGGTVIKSSQFNGSNFAAANAFDRNTATGYAAIGSVGQWIGYQHSSPVEVDKIRLRASAAFPGNNAYGILVEYSDDGSTWIILSSLYDPGGAMAASADRTLDFVNENLYSGGDTSAHRYWRMRSLINGQDGFQNIAEIDLLDASDASLTTAHGGTPTASNTQSGFPASNAWDKNAATLWYSDSIYAEYWHKWDFGSGNAQVVEKLYLKADASNPGRTVRAFVVEFSDDNSTWTARYVQDGYETWTSAQARTYPFDAPSPPGDIFVDFDFNWKIAHNITRTFDYAIKRTITRDVSFDWQIFRFGRTVDFSYKIALGRSFDFDWKIGLHKDFTFDWVIDGEFRVDFNFDYRIQLGVSKSFDWKIRLFKSFDFDWAIGEVGSVGAAYIERFPELPVKETWQYYTKINSSENNTERRASLRQYPRIALDHQYVMENAADYRLFRGYMFAQRYTDFYVAQHAQAIFLTVTSAYGSTTITCHRGNADLRDGDFVVIFDIGTETSTLVHVVTVDDEALELETGLPFAVGPGFALIPVRLMRFKDGQSLAMNAITGSFNAVFEDATVRPIIRNGADTGLVAVLDGRPLIDRRAVLDGSRDNAFATGRRTIDFAPDQAAKTIKYWNIPEETTTYTAVFERGESIDYWREFADTVRGSWKSFYMPTWRADLVPISFAGSSLSIVGTHDDDMLGSLAYRNLMITTDNGIQYNSVIGAIVIDDHTQLTLHDAIDGTVIKEISYVNRVRIVDDVFAFEHHETFTKLTLNIRVVKI